MYTLRLMGSLDRIHQEKFNTFKTNCKKNICPNCTATLDVTFDQYHSKSDDLMVRVDFYCSSCHWSKSVSYKYAEVTQ